MESGMGGHVVGSECIFDALVIQVVLANVHLVHLRPQCSRSLRIAFGDRLVWIVSGGALKIFPRALLVNSVFILYPL